MKKLLLILLMGAFCTKAFSQEIPLDMLVQSRYNDLLLHSDTALFSGFRSINWLEVKPWLAGLKNGAVDSVFGISPESSSYFLQHTTTSNWIQVKSRKNIIAIDPYFIANAGLEKNYSSSALFNVAAGIRIQGVYDDKLSYSFGYSRNSMRLPNYVTENILANQLYVPGMGQATLSNNGVFSLNQFTGNLTYIAGDHFVLSAGYGKNFIGDGYRSLLLSDNPSSNPYIRLKAKLWKLDYNVLYNRYQNPRFPVDDKPQGKYSVMHYLGINVSKRLQVGLYDQIIWLASDSGVHRGIDFQYLNPLIFLRPLEYGIGSPDNAFMGFTLKYLLWKHSYWYGQLGIDDLNFSATYKNKKQHLNNKYAIQMGIFTADFLRIKNLSYRLEWNGVRPYTYGYRNSNIGLNYTHNNQSLADPFNANFHEFISMLMYHSDRWYGYLQNIYTIRGENPGLAYPNGDNLWGGENNVPAFGSKTLQGIKNHYSFNHVSAGYLINPRNRLCLQADFVYRRHTAPGMAASSDAFFNIGITTRLFNHNNDF